MRRTVVLTVTGWLAAAIVATVTGIAVVTLIARLLIGPPADDPLSQDDVAGALATSPSPTVAGVAVEETPSPSPSTASPSPSPKKPRPEPERRTRSPEPEPTPSDSPSPDKAPKPRTRALNTPGGTVVARCAGTRVTLLSWSPAQGYAVDDVDPGPAKQATVTFERSRSEVQAKVTCVEGRPFIRVDFE